MPTFVQILDKSLRADPGRPLITFYDFESGERTELSVTTYANWVAKAGSLLVEECDLERGQQLLLDLPTHWLGPVFLGAAWTAGLEVVWSDPAYPRRADAVVCGPAELAIYADLAADLPVLVSALLPMGVRFPEPLPVDVLDVGVQIWGQPDAFTPWDPPTGADPAVAGATQDQVWADAANSSVAEGARVLSQVNPASASGLAAFTGALARAGSLVLAVRASADQLEAMSADERVTAHFAS